MRSTARTRKLRAELARRGLGYVLAVRKSHHRRRPLPACELARRLPARAWQRLSAGPGAKGPRWYDWALIEAARPGRYPGRRAALAADPPPDQRRRARLLPRPRTPSRAIGPARARGRVQVEGRGRVRGGKELAALDEHQVRSWTSWHRWTILALLACAFLSVLASQAATGPPRRWAADPADPPLRSAACSPACPGNGCTSGTAALVPMATPASGHRPRLPLPPTSPITLMITKCRWSTSEAPPQTA